MKENKNYYIETWGCQMNEEDSEKYSGMLKEMDFDRVENKEDADIIIFNTCCIRENAEQKVYGNLGTLKRLKKENPELKIVLTGCMMQQDTMPEKIKEKFPYVDIIMGTHNAHKLPEYINYVLQTDKNVVEILDKEEGIIEDIPVDRESSIKAFVTITYGCNNFCSYCIVPYVRGRERSRTPENIENEIKELVSKGYKEITLLGQNVNSYGKDLEPKVFFSELIKRINKIDGLERIRFMTSHPKDLTEDVVDAIVESEKACEQIHLPVQSGSTKVLKEMNRNYTREKYINLIKMIRAKLPNVAITTDIIVGFPGETEEDFNQTLELVKEVEYDSAFTFLYSKREGTPAYNMEDQIPEDIKHERFNRLIEIINKISEKKNKEYDGKVVEVLVEGYSKNDSEKFAGRTRTGKLVNFSAHSNCIGKLVNVKITEAKSFSLQGVQI